jgi:conjugative transposon TraN protein
MPENIKLVDISTDNIIGNQCTENMVRIKPAPADSIGLKRFSDDDFLGTVTLIGERHIAQYDIIYDWSPKDANAIYNVTYEESQAYTNPEVSMPESEMSRYAWAIYGSKRKFNNIRTRAYGIKAEVYNIYSIGDYFFIDFGLRNRSNIAYDIDEIRVTLTDRKETKATNSQTIQLNPVYSLNPAARFKKSYRQVLVLNKLSFPEEKQINISISEKQISGRTITLSMDYADILNADGFDIDKYSKDISVKQVRQQYVADNSADKDLKKVNDSLTKRNAQLSRRLADANSQITLLQTNVEIISESLRKMTEAYNGANATINRMLGKE